MVEDLRSAVASFPDRSPSEVGSTKPLVSIVIVSYNHREYIGPAIESALAQHYPNIEIVISDDASTDGTSEVVKSFEKRYPERIRAVVQPKNIGITANSNAALSLARGKYIAFLGSDDLLLPGKVSAQVELMERDSGCVICYHDLDVFQSESGTTLWRFSHRNHPKEGDGLTLIRYGCFNGACSTMVRRAAMPVSGFDPRISACSDWLFWIQTAQNGTIRYIGEVLGRYRRHDTNITGSSEKLAPMVHDHLSTMMLVLVDRPRAAPEIAYRTGHILLSFGRRRRGLERFLLFVFGGLLCMLYPPLLVARLLGRFFWQRNT